MHTRIGMAGLGIMGRGMANNLLRHGFAVSVWNRSPERAAEFSDRATVAKSPRELAASCSVVIGCVSDPPAVERVVFAEDGVLAGAQPGFRYVESSTVSSALTRRIAEAMRARGADALDAPVTGSKEAAEAGTLLFMTGGRQETHDELLSVLMAMGKKAIYCGESGQGSRMKLVGNTLISFMLEGLCEGLVAAAQGGLPTATVLEVIMASGFASPYFAFKGRALAEHDFAPHFALDLLVKDQTLMLAEASSLDVPMPGLSAIREVFRMAQARGYGRDDIAGVVRVLERAGESQTHQRS
jgi:3-hydroxyisobutyrate dehydrogenase-like beta-hydroxyacid dehydrogenase